LTSVLTPTESLRRGQELIRAGLEMAALEHFANAHQSCPDDPGLRSFYGWAVATIEHRFERGLALCRESLREDADNPEVYLNIARVLRAHGRKSEAIRFLKRGLMVDPLNPTLLAEWRAIGVRRRPVLPFLSRRHALNRLLGRVRGRLTGEPTPPPLVAREAG
jgi:tetratricopeptide (TPR) repeat protein